MRRGVVAARRRWATPVAVDAVAGLVGWYKADAITGKVDGDAIAQWDDSSGGALHAVQATGTKQPLYKTAIKNGLPAVFFDGTDDTLTIAGITNNDASRTVVAVARRSAAQGATRRLLGWNTTEGALFDNNTKWGYFPNQANGAVTLNGGSPARASIVSLKYVDTATAVAYVNGVPTSFDPADAYQSGTRALSLGSGANLNFWTGYLFEVAVYNSALSDADRAGVEATLAAKWGI